MTFIREGLESADLDFPATAPLINLDFANSQNLDERITFTRTSSGTFVNKNGLISIASTNVPRFDYDPVTGESKGLLIEESRTNYFLNTNNLSAGVGGLNVISTGDVHPDGTTANLYIVNSSTAFHWFANTITPIDITSTPVSGTVNLSYSVFLKNYGVNNPSVLYGFETDDIANKYCLVKARTSTKTITNENVSSGWSVTNTKVEPYGNDWFRYSVSAQYTKAVGINTVYWLGMQVHSPSPADQQFYYGDNQTGIYIWGPQCEVGSFPTSFIPTYGSQQTRSAEVVEIRGNNFSSWFTNDSPQELSVFYSGLALYTTISGATYWSIRSESLSEAMEFGYAGLPQVFLVSDGSYLGGGVFAGTGNISDMKAIGLIDNKSFQIILQDGKLDYVYSTNTVVKKFPSIFTRMFIGNTNGYNQLNGTLKKITIYPKRLTVNQAVNLVR